MFETFELQYLNKLIESEIGDFPSPQAFHSVYVQRFKSKCLKASTQVSRKFPMPILAFPTDLPIKPCKLSHTPPPVIRTFLFSRKTLIECAELFQGLLQKLRRLYFLTCAKCQVSVFHSEVCPHTFTRSGQGFGRSIVCNDVKPVFTNSIAQDLDVSDITIPLSVLVKRESFASKLQTLRLFVPLSERQGDRTFLKFVTRLKLRRTITSFSFELWETDRRVFESTFISKVNTDNHSIKGITRYPCPVLFTPFEQLRQMRLQSISTRIFTIPTIVAFLQSQEVIVNVRKFVKQIAQPFVLWVITDLICIRSHGCISYQFF